MHTLAEDPWVVRNVLGLFHYAFWFPERHSLTLTLFPPLQWHSLCKDKFPFIGGGIEGTDWKKTYFKRSKLQRGWDGGKAGDFTVTSMRGHDGYITKVGLVKNIAFTGGSTGQVKAWRANTSKLSFECTGHTSAITALEIFDTSILTASLDSTVKLWDLQTGVQVRDMRVGSGVTYAAASSSSSKQGLFATTSGLCHLYDLRDATRTSVQTGYHAEVRGVVALEGDAGVGTKFAIARTNGLYLHDTTAPNNLDNALNSLVQPHSIEFLQVAGSDLLAASSGSNILLWNWKTGQTVWTLPLPIALNSITAMKADSTHILAGTSDGTVFVIRHRNPQVVKINAHPGSRVNDIQFDQHRIVTAGGDNSIKVWDKSGSPVYTLLGGSLQIRGSALPHPTKPGCSSLFYDDNRIVASFANVLKSFNFSVE